jgi:hypothetical protein
VNSTSEESGADETATAHRARGIPSRPLRWLINAGLILHLTAIIVAPASVSPSSDLARSAWVLCQPYLEALYLNNGYHFFAPEPGPSTLVAFVAEREDGSTYRGRIPDRNIRPRLLYHRHFMLSEHMNLAPEEIQEQWYRSYALHLGRKYHATKVALTKVTHRLPTMEMVRSGVPLDDPASYDEQPLGVFRCDESSVK